MTVDRTTDADEGIWTKSQRCSSAQCVEISRGATGTRIRDSKQEAAGPLQPIIALTVDGWREFSDRILAGEIGNLPDLDIRQHDNGDTTLSDGKVRLNFDADEWSAFVGGLVDGDFD